MKIAGHPVHLMLVHFPTALLLMDWVCLLLCYCTNDSSFAAASFYAGVGGVTTGWLAITFGLLDLVAIAPEKKKVLQTGLLHGAINSTVVIIFTVFVYLEWKVYPEWKEPALGTLIAKGCVFLVLAGNYLGGNLVLKYHIGSMNDKAV